MALLTQKKDSMNEIPRILQPQEIEVFYLIPALRRAFTIELKKLGKSQKEIASILGVTEASVSQYLSNKRASLIQLDIETQTAVQRSASNIQNHFDVIRETQHLLKLMRDSRMICKVHHQLSQLPKTCDIKIMGCNL